MPLTHWWSGAEGRILEVMGIRSFPTIYVLDAEGVIRYKGLRREELEKAVNDLLKETEARKTAGM